MRLETATLAQWCGGRLIGESVLVEGAGLDSRTIRPGQLFVAVKGGRDGHHFIPDALRAGAAAVLTTDPSTEAPAVLVPDTVEALSRIATRARGAFGGRVVGITGSVGKTSVKDLTHAAAAASLVVHSSHRSFNNELGVPITILEAPEGTAALVLEMGARGSGHIADLCRIAAPDVGVVTSVALAHGEHFGDIAGVAIAKGELVESLPRSGHAVLNVDDSLVAAMATRTEAAVIEYGKGRGDFAYEAIALDDLMRPTFTLSTPNGRLKVNMEHVSGVHNVANATAALATAWVLGADIDAAVEALRTARLSPWRMQVHRSATGATIINDAYNANPASMAAALEALREATDGGRAVAVLGFMAELGDHSSASHAAVADLARDLEIDLIAYESEEYGVEPVHGPEEAVDAVGLLGTGDALLLKGSRVAGLERLADHFP